jgi:hypothetical protein
MLPRCISHSAKVPDVLHVATRVAAADLADAVGEEDSDEDSENAIGDEESANRHSARPVMAWFPDAVRCGFSASVFSLYGVPYCRCASGDRSQNLSR